MAIFQFSTLPSETNLSSFNPSTDVLQFDDPTITPISAFFDVLPITSAVNPTQVNLIFGTKFVTLPFSAYSLTDTNVTFASGGKLLVGDNTVGTVNDDAGNTLTGTDSGDWIIGYGGADIIDAGGGDDVIHLAGAAFGRGEAGNDTINGGAGRDWVLLDDAAGGGYQLDLTAGFGRVGNSILSVLNVENVGGSEFDDAIAGSAGANLIDGGGGRDTYYVYGALADFTITKTGNFATLQDNVGTGGFDALVDVERIHFANLSVALDTDNTPAAAFRLYLAAFNRTPDLAGLGYWIKQTDNGMGLADVSAAFVASNEFKTLYGPNPTSEQFLTGLYQNVLHRAPDQAGLDWWVHHMAPVASGGDGADMASVLHAFAESPENQGNVVSLIANGIAYQDWPG